jgi:hypothetical protein
MMVGVINYLKDKHFETWIGGYARHVLERQRDPKPVGPRHLLFAFCDHWEPLWNDASEEAADTRVRAWAEGYPKLASEFRDAEGKSPRHSFFFPGEQYRPAWLDTLADFTRRGIGEVELHLHHANDTKETLRADLLGSLSLFAERPPLRPDGRLRYAFIHGNWCLANAREAAPSAASTRDPLLQGPAATRTSPSRRAGPGQPTS